MSKINPSIGVEPLFNQKQKLIDSGTSQLLKPSNNVNYSSRDNFSLGNQSVIGMKIVFESVSNKFASSNNFSQRALQHPSGSKINNQELNSTKEVNNIFDFEKVAETVMSFVSSSLNAAKERGSTDEELEGMLIQARSGVNQGIDEALVELKELSLLDEDLTSGIEKSRELISQGIDKLSDQFFQNIEVDEQNHDIELEQVAKYSSDLARVNSKSSDLTIITADGDTVSISFSDYHTQQKSQRYTRHEDDGSTSPLYQSSRESYRELNFSYTIEGDLDEEEKAAISSLIKEVNQLQKDFFNGDIEKAYQQVLQLGFDDEQLSSLSLDIQQEQTSYMSQSYTEVASFQDNELDQLQKQLKPILDFVEQFRQVDKSADKLFGSEKRDKGDHFEQLLQSVFKAEFGDSDNRLNHFKQFIEKLL